MSRTLFIRFCDPILMAPDAMRVEWALLPERGDGRMSTGPAPLAQSLQDVQASGEKVDEVVVLIPGEHVLVTVAPIYHKQKNQMAAALHYVVEDQLAAPADSVHAALGEAIPGSTAADIQHYQVAVIKKEIMDSVLATLRAFQIIPDVVTSEAFLAPYEAKSISVFLEKNKALLSAAPALVTSIERQNLEMLLSSHIKDLATPSAPANLRLYTPASEAEDASPIIDSLSGWTARHGILFEHSSFAEAPLVKLCRNYSAQAARVINLIQGAYRPQKNHFYRLLNAKALATVVCIFFAINGLLAMGESVYLQIKAGTLHDLSLKEYHSLFPDDSRIIDIRAQMQQHLSRYRVGDNKSFLGLMSQLATGMQPPWPAQVTVRRMEYDEQKSTVAMDVEAPDIAQLEGLKEALKSSTLQSKMDSVNQSGGAAKSHLVISPPAAGTP